MKLKTEELKKFLATAGQIKPNITATNLDSIYIECTGSEIIFTKTNNNIWCRYSYVCQPSERETYLINERMLNGVALTTKEFEINIELRKDEVKITSGEDVLKTKNQDLKLFPVMPSASSDKVRISKEAVERIRIASKYISRAINRTALNFVNIGLDGIFAFNGNVAYYHDTFGLPEVFFDEEPLALIKGTDDMFYWAGANYDFFQLEGFTFGFIKTVVQPVPFLTIVQQTGDVNFAVKKEDFINFCTLVQYSKRQENPIATFASTQADCNMLELKYLDADFNIDVNRNVQAQASSNIEEFKFVVDATALMLKTLPYDQLIFTKLQTGHYAVTTPEDAGYKGIIARLN